MTGFYAREVLASIAVLIIAFGIVAWIVNACS